MTVKKYRYVCNDCGRSYDSHAIRYLCPECSTTNTPDNPPKGVLKVAYNWDSLLAEPSPEKRWTMIQENNYLDVLPVNKVESFPMLRVGKTPVYKVSQNFGETETNVWVKDDSQNPTYSFKDRASMLVSAFAKEHGIETIATASTGNAGSSIAGICAAQNQRAIVFVPEKAPLAKLTQIAMYGAHLIPVKGTYDDAFDLSLEASNAFGWYNRNTAYNPLTIEGKKTVAFEIYEQFHGQLPDLIFVPVGDGVIISGVYKGFEDLLHLKLIDKMPVIVAVQAMGSNNLVSNMNKDSFIANNGQTIADSISVSIPRNYYMAIKYLKNYEGLTVEVSDPEILNAMYQLSKQTGLFTEPASAAAFAGYLKFKQQNLLTNIKKVLILLTGSGLKDLSATQSLISLPEAITCNLEAVKKVLDL